MNIFYFFSNQQIIHIIIVKFTILKSTYLRRVGTFWRNKLLSSSYSFCIFWFEEEDLFLKILDRLGKDLFFFMQRLHQTIDFSDCYNLNRMALLKEDNLFTHVIAIDFGTGASG